MFHSNSQYIAMRILFPLLLCAVLSACGGGGSDSPAPAPVPTPVPTPPPVAATLTLSSPTVRTVTGGSAIPLTATLSSGAAVRWQLPAGAPGSLSADTGTTVRYQPPAGALAAPATVTVTASGDGASASLTLAVTPVPTAAGVFTMPWRTTTGATMHVPRLVTTDFAGNTYVVSYVDAAPLRRGSANLTRIAPDNTATTLISDETWFGQPVPQETLRRLDFISSFAADRAGNLYFVAGEAIAPPLQAGQQYNDGPVILKVTPEGVMSTLAGSSEPQVGAMTDGTGSAARFLDPQIVDADFDHLYVLDNQGAAVRKVSTAGVVTTIQALPSNLRADQDGNTYAYDPATTKLKRTAPGGTTSLVTNLPYCSEVTPVSPRSCLPISPYQLIPAGGATYIVVSDGYPRRLVLPAAGSPPVTTLALSSPTLRTTAGGSAIPLSANLSSGGPVTWQLADGAPGTLSATSGATVNYIPPTGAIVPGTAVNIVASGDGVRASLTLAITAESRPAGVFEMPWRNSSEPTMHRPHSIATDIAGNTYVLSYTDAAPTRRGTPHLYRIAPDNTVTVLIDDASWFGIPISAANANDQNAGRLAWVSGFAADKEGNLYFAVTPGGIGLAPGQPSTSGPAILKVAPGGGMWVLAGSTDAQTGALTDGTGNVARFLDPTIVGADFDGNIYVRDGDGDDATLRKVTADGVVSTPAVLPKGILADRDGANYAYDAASTRLARTSATGVRTLVTNVAYCADGTPVPPLACLGSTGYNLMPSTAVSYVVFDGVSLRRLVLAH